GPQARVELLRAAAEGDQLPGLRPRCGGTGRGRDQGGADTAAGSRSGTAQDAPGGVNPAGTPATGAPATGASVFPVRRAADLLLVGGRPVVLSVRRASSDLRLPPDGTGRCDPPPLRARSAVGPS